MTPPTRPPTRTTATTPNAAAMTPPPSLACSPGVGSANPGGSLLGATGCGDGGAAVAPTNSGLPTPTCHADTSKPLRPASCSTKSATRPCPALPPTSVAAPRVARNNCTRSTSSAATRRPAPPTGATSTRTLARGAPTASATATRTEAARSINRSSGRPSAAAIVTRKRTSSPSAAQAAASQLRAAAGAAAAAAQSAARPEGQRTVRVCAAQSAPQDDHTEISQAQAEAPSHSSLSVGRAPAHAAAPASMEQRTSRSRAPRPQALPQAPQSDTIHSQPAVAWHALSSSGLGPVGATSPCGATFRRCKPGPQVALQADHGPMTQPQPTSATQGSNDAGAAPGHSASSPPEHLTLRDRKPAPHVSEHSDHSPTHHEQPTDSAQGRTTAGAARASQAALRQEAVRCCAPTPQETLQRDHGVVVHPQALRSSHSRSSAGRASAAQSSSSPLAQATRRRCKPWPQSAEHADHSPVNHSHVAGAAQNLELAGGSPAQALPATAASGWSHVTMRACRPRPQAASHADHSPTLQAQSAA